MEEERTGRKKQTSCLSAVFGFCRCCQLSVWVSLCAGACPTVCVFKDTASSKRWWLPSSVSSNLKLPKKPFNLEHRGTRPCRHCSSRFSSSVPWWSCASPASPSAVRLDCRCSAEIEESPESLSVIGNPAVREHQWSPEECHRRAWSFCRWERREREFANDHQRVSTNGLKN